MRTILQTNHPAIQLTVFNPSLFLTRLLSRFEPMTSPLIKIDDKHIPLNRVVWVSDVPHFCGEPDCMHEGDYEVRLDVDDSLWTNTSGRNEVLKSLARWCGDTKPEDEEQGPDQTDW